MKNYNEMANDVIRRINEYESEKRRKNAIIKNAIGICCITLFLIGIFVFPMLPRHSGPVSIDNSETSAEPNRTMDIIENVESAETESTGLTNASPETTAVASPDNSESVSIESTDISDETEEIIPDKIDIISLFQANTGEFAADMHRPDGFNKNIGSVLAIKMNMSDNPEAAFPVIISHKKNSDMAQIIDYVNNTYDVKIAMKDIMPVNISGIILTSRTYYFAMLTSDQILTLAENSVNCSYVGSGIGDYKDMNWDTKDGINTYCEIFGDMFTFDSTGFECSPDISIY